MKRKKENVRLKQQIIANILALIILINPVFNLSKYFKNKLKATTPTETTNTTTEKKKTYFELIDEITSNPEIDFHNLTLPTHNESCTYTNDIISNDNLYNQTTELISIIKKNSIDYINTNPKYFLGFTNIEDKNTNKESNTDQIMIQSIFRDALSDILINSIYVS